MKDPYFEGYQIILNEKEKMYNASKFVVDLMVDNILNFNQYIQREGSITNTVNKKLYHYIDNMNGVVEFYKNRKLYDEYQKELEYVYVRYVYATFIRSVKRYSYKDYMEACEVAIKNVKSHFPKYRKNKYFYRSLKGLYLVVFNKFIAKIIYRI